MKSYKKVLSVLTLSFFLPAAVLGKMPNDPELDAWGYESVEVFEAWEDAQGSRDVVVAVIDNGFDTFHSDLLENVWKNVDEIANNGKDDDNNGYIDDVWGWNFVAEKKETQEVVNGKTQKVIEWIGDNDPRPKVTDLTKAQKEDGVVHHGTIVAGIIGAVGDNHKETAGINWRVRLMNLKVVDETGSGVMVPLADAIRYAVDNGAHVINMSLVGNNDFNSLSAIQYAYDNGVALVAAAGNAVGAHAPANLNETPFYPVCADRMLGQQTILGVSAITEKHQIAQFSNTGSDCVDLTAPGVGQPGLLRYSPTNGLDEKYGGSWSGTSFAAPYVAGAIALVKSIQPSWEAPQLYEAILSTLHKTEGQDETVYANLFGNGLLQIHNAVAYALEGGEDGDPVVVAPTSVYAYVPETGLAGEKIVGIAKRDVRSISALRNVLEVADYYVGGERFFVTIKRDRPGVLRVSTYTENWKRVSTWTTKSDVDMTIVAANVLGDTAAEILIGPKGESQTIAKIFTPQGKPLGTIESEELHSGVMLSAVKQDGQAHADIVTVYDENEVPTVHIFAADTGSLLSSFEAPEAADTVSLGVGDVDGDLAAEFIFGRGAGETAEVVVYGQDGFLESTFTPYGKDFDHGISLTIRDYDADGTDDIVVGSLIGGHMIRVFSSDGDAITQWYPFGKRGDRTSGFLLIR